MQNIVFVRPYEFVPPRRGRFWPWLLRRWAPRLLRTKHGVASVECRNAERLRASVEAGHGILIAANHCRPCDPFVLDWLGRAVGRPLHIMAGWHLFLQNRVQAFLLPRIGVFSVYREGTDREALRCAISILAEARRPLVLFPEGVISRHNDRLNHLMDGTALMARSAAKERAAQSPPGRVVIHPVAIRWVFDGDAAAAASSMLDDVERRLSWRPEPARPLLERILRVGSALLALKEIELTGEAGHGDVAPRVSRLIEHILRPMEEEWLRGRSEPNVVARVKALRTAIVPTILDGDVPSDVRARRDRQLEDLYLAQQLSCYPANYLAGEPTPERILETVERFEEDLTDDVRPLRWWRAVLHVGEAIEVPPDRQRGGEGDPVMRALRESLESMLAASLAEHRPGARMP